MRLTVSSEVVMAFHSNTILRLLDICILHELLIYASNVPIILSFMIFRV
uniref:Uncharacterized protein n=1 Tax=Rhizophora mucronata TaxID=61149 RepID=A0A2P2QP72_RHIMU